MKAKNKKQVDIVKDTGISKGAFSSYLSGQYNPKADKMELIADSLDVDLRRLYGQNVPMEHTSQNDNALQYVFYNNSCSEYLLDNLDDIYIAMMTQYAALIPVSYTHLDVYKRQIFRFRCHFQTFRHRFHLSRK